MGRVHAYKPKSPPQSCLQVGGEEDSKDADMMAVKRYFSGDDDVEEERGTSSRQEAEDPPPEGTSSSTIVSGLVASRKQDQPVRLRQH